MDEIALNMIALADELEGFIHEVVPESETVQKYGGTLFTLRPEEKEGQFCGVFVYRNHVQISFSKGAVLDDPGGLLQGGGKVRRHINFISSEHVSHEALRKLFKQASRL